MSTIWPDTGTSACLGPVWSEPVRNGFSNMMTPPNLEPDRRSGSAQGTNLELNHGPVRLGSGSDHGSEPNLTTPRCNWSKPGDQVDATKDCINWNNGGSAVSSLHRP